MPALRFFLALLFLATSPAAVAATCHGGEFSDPAQVRFPGDSLLLVVHGTSTHDARFASKRGIDEAIRWAKGRQIPVVYLQDDTPEQFYFMEDCAPDHRVRSQGGEIPFGVPQGHIYVVGGHLELCHLTALHDILHMWAAAPSRNYTITYFMDAIYSNGRMIDHSQPFYGDFVRFLNIVTYGRPGGEHWPKLTLLETMGIIVREEHELDYIRQILPRWDRSLPEGFRVEVQMNDSVKKVLRGAPGWHPPTLLFHFVDSAANLSGPPLRQGP